MHRHGGDIAFQRSYSSQHFYSPRCEAFDQTLFWGYPTVGGADQYSGSASPFGNSWTHSYNIHVFYDTGTNFPYPVENQPANLKICMPDGTIRTIYNMQNDMNPDAISVFYPDVNTATLPHYWPDPALMAKSFVIASDYSGSTLTFKDGSVWQFNNIGYLISKTDRFGNQTTLIYNGDLLTQVNDSNGNVALSFTYDGNGRIVQVQAPEGQTLIYTYSTSGDLATVAYPGGQSATYNYQDCFLRTTPNPNLFMYYGDALLTSYVDDRAPKGFRQVTLTYDIVDVNDENNPGGSNLFPELSTATDGLNRTFATNTYIPGGGEDTPWEKDSVDAKGGTWKTLADFQTRQVLEKITPLGTTQIFTPSDFEIPKTIVDENNISTNNTFDSLGNATQVQDGTGAISKVNYDPTYSVPMSETDAKGRTISYTLDPSKKTIVTKPDLQGNPWNCTYYGTGELWTVTPPNLPAVTYEYDPNGNLNRVRDALGNYTTYFYDQLGRCTAMTDASTATTIYHRDTVGRITSISYPDSTSCSWTYDSHSNMLTYRDRNQHTTYYTYDAADQLLTVLDPNNKSTQYDYDLNGNLKHVTDGASNVTTYHYDANNRVTEVDDTVGVTKYEYDGSTHVTKETKPDTQELYAAYDGDYRMTSSGHEGYAYDSMGHLTETVDALGITTYHFDSDDRLSEVDDPRHVSLHYGYDTASRRTSFSTTGASTNVSLSYLYYDNNRLKSVTGPDGTMSIDVYDPLGNPRVETYPNGVHCATTYTPGVYTLSSMANFAPGGQQITSDTYTYDNVGNVASDQNLVGTSTYLYDAGDQLSIQVESHTAYSYDLANNISGIANPGHGTSFNYNGANQLTNFYGTIFTYDSNGNLWTKGSSSFSWDLKNRMTHASNGTLSIGYVYNAANLRVQKNSASGTTNYFYDGSTLILETDGSLTTQRLYTPGVSYADSTGTRNYYLNNGHGDVVALADSHGELVQNYIYDTAHPFGSLVNGTTDSNPQRYAGGAGVYSDDDFGLQYMQNRWYDPQIMRFISRDPLGFGGGDLNLYRYCGNNPLSHVDPMGLDDDGCGDGPQGGPGSAPSGGWSWSQDSGGSWTATFSSPDSAGQAPSSGGSSPPSGNTSSGGQDYGSPTSIGVGTAVISGPGGIPIIVNVASGTASLLPRSNAGSQPLLDAFPGGYINKELAIVSLGASGFGLFGAEGGLLGILSKIAAVFGVTESSVNLAGQELPRGVSFGGNLFSLGVDAATKNSSGVVFGNAGRIVQR